MGLVPMHLGAVELSVWDADQRCTFDLTPSAPAKVQSPRYRRQLENLPSTWRFYFTTLLSRAGRNSSPARHVGSFGEFATSIPISNPKRAYSSIPETSQSS